MKNKSEDSAALPTQQQFNKLVTSKVGSLLSSKLNGTFIATPYPAGFPYCVTYGMNDYYNKDSLRILDSLFNDSGDIPTIDDVSFSQFYLQVLQNIHYEICAGDQKIMKDAETTAEAQIHSVIAAFTDAGWDFPNPLPPSTPNKFAYVMSFIVEQFGDYSKIPDTYTQLRTSVADYKMKAEQAYLLHQNYATSDQRLTALRGNIMSPSGSNGGLQTDKTTYAVAYDGIPTANALIGELQKDGNSIDITIEVDQFESNQTHLQIDQDYKTTIPASIIFGAAINQSHYTYDSFASADTELRMTIRYPGVTVIASAPRLLSGDNTTGWYNAEVIREAAENTGNADKTGFKLFGSTFDPKTLFNKKLARLKTLVISQEPTIKMVFNKVDISKVSSVFTQHSSMKFNLFGLFDFGGKDTGYTVTNISNNVSEQSVTITLGPSQPSGTIPPENQVAYVLGGVVDYPAGGS
jgi:hypothetical protein